MGNFEKLAVLTVVFGAAIVLAISLNRGKSEAEAASPLGEAAALLADHDDAGRAADPVGSGAVEPRVREEHGSLLLSAGDAEGALSVPDLDTGAEPVPEALTLEPRSDPNHRILLESTGLRPSFLDEFMVYRVAEGDTWSGLAQRFYQDGRYTRNLHLANEGLPSLRPGGEILVPVFDFIALDAGLRAASEQPLAGSESQPSVAIERARIERPRTEGTETPRALAPVGGTGALLAEYEVRSGDTLSDISLAVFGTSKRWKEILEANSDKLQRPESLQVGMKLVIPAGGKVPPASETRKKTSSPAPAKTGKKKVR